MTYRILKKHNKNCRAVETVKEKIWTTPWSSIPDGVLWLDSVGRRNGNGGNYIPWLLLRCNSNDCEAEKIVKADVLALEGE